MANVPVVRTPFSRREFARALIMAWKHVVGHFPTKKAAGIIFAHYRLETGDGGYCWNFNIGNCKCTRDMANAGVPYMMLADTWEIIGGKKVLFQPPHQMTWFRAFESLSEGMTAHLNLLRNERYESCWASVENGEPHEFAVKLKEKGYYTGFLSAYSALMETGHSIWMKDPAFDDAMLDVLAKLDADTERDLSKLGGEDLDDDGTVIVDVPIIHPAIDFEPRKYDDGPGDDEPPPDAA